MENPDYRFSRKSISIEVCVTEYGMEFGGRLETGEHLAESRVSWAELDTLRSVRDGTYGAKPDGV